jgi:hypothetical protein
MSFYTHLKDNLLVFIRTNMFQTKVTEKNETRICVICTFLIGLIVKASLTTLQTRHLSRVLAKLLGETDCVHKLKLTKTHSFLKVSRKTYQASRHVSET